MNLAAARFAVRLFGRGIAGNLAGGLLAAYLGKKMLNGARSRRRMYY